MEPGIFLQNTTAEEERAWGKVIIEEQMTPIPSPTAVGCMGEREKLSHEASTKHGSGSAEGTKMPLHCPPQYHQRDTSIQTALSSVWAWAHTCRQRADGFLTTYPFKPGLERWMSWVFNFISCEKSSLQEVFSEESFCAMLQQPMIKAT